MNAEQLLRSIFYTGVVVNINDPLNLGRLQVRLFGLHSEYEADIKNDDLNWSVVLSPTNLNGSVGTIPPCQLLPGSVVMGSFLDGTAQQLFCVIGSVPGLQTKKFPGAFGKYTNTKATPKVKAFPAKVPEKTDYKAHDNAVANIIAKLSNGESVTSLIAQILTDPTPLLNIFSDSEEKIDLTQNPRSSRFGEPDISPLARNSASAQNSKIMKAKAKVVTVTNADGSTWTEKPTEFKPQYPFNAVNETIGGHVFEADNTPGAERISEFHKSGTYYEIHPKGDKVTKVIGNNYEIIMKNNYVTIKGNCFVTIEGNTQLQVNGNVTEKINGNVKQTIVGNVDQTIKGNHTATINGNSNITANKNVNLTVKDSLTIKATNAINFETKNFNIKSTKFSINTTTFDLKSSNATFQSSSISEIKGGMVSINGTMVTIG